MATPDVPPNAAVTGVSAPRGKARDRLSRTHNHQTPTTITKMPIVPTIHHVLVMALSSVRAWPRAPKVPRL
jgi:hypothetical protein